VLSMFIRFCPEKAPPPPMLGMMTPCRLRTATTGFCLSAKNFRTSLNTPATDESYTALWINLTSSMSARAEHRARLAPYLLQEEPPGQ